MNIFSFTCTVLPSDKIHVYNFLKAFFLDISKLSLLIFSLNKFVHVKACSVQHLGVCEYSKLLSNKLNIALFDSVSKLNSHYICKYECFSNIVFKFLKSPAIR